MDSTITIQHNKLIQLDNSMLMYGVYNAETLENSLTQYTKYITPHPPMKDCLQDNKAHQHLDHFTQACLDYSIIP